MRDFDGKVILVTGGATGLGAAIAIGAAQRGAHAVILNCSKSVKEAEATAETVRAAGAEVSIAQGDVSEDVDCRKIAEVAARYGRLDGLANNAGITKHVRHADLDGLSKADFLHLYAVNTVGPYQMVRACRSLLEKATGQASVVMTSSIAGVRGIGSYGDEQLARIRENVAQSTPLQVASTPEDIADAALFLLSDAARRVTGETLLADAGFHLGQLPQRGPR